MPKPFHKKLTLEPNGDRAKRWLDVEHYADHINILFGHDNQPGVYADWWNDRLQLLAYDGQCDETAGAIRLNPDGSVAEIIVRDDLLDKVMREPVKQTAWGKERDDAE